MGALTVGGEAVGEGLEADLCRPQALGFCADGVCCIGGDAVVVGRERDSHSLKGQADAVFFFVLGVQQEEVGEVDGAAGDVYRLECDYERLGETLDVVVAGGSNDLWEGGLHLSEEVLRDLGGRHRHGGVVPVAGAAGAAGENAGEREDCAVVSVVAGVWTGRRGVEG